MHLHIYCVLACISLKFAAAGGKWEVINDVKPYDDSGTQEDILSEEELIPFKPSKPKPRPAAPPKQPVPRNDDTRSYRKVTKAPLPKVKQTAMGGSDIGEEELLPLGVPRNSNKRRLLQFAPRQGPRLPPEEELRRLRLRSDAVNLSTSCKDSDDDDCFFDVDAYVLEQLSKGSVKNAEEDFEFSQEREDWAPVSEEGGLRHPFSRHKRQTNNNAPIDLTEEGSGVNVEQTLYENQTEYKNEGVYKYSSTIGIDFPNATLTEQQKTEYQKEFQKQIENAFNATYIQVEVGEPVLTNGILESNFTLLIDGVRATSANELGSTNLEEFLLNHLKNASIPAFNNITIFQTPIHHNYKINTGFFVNALRTILDDYCGSQDPCPGVGPEYNVSACINDGFMSGYCPHKCSMYPCQNGAICELDDSYEPTCNCGDRYSGTFCETDSGATTGLTTGETVGVGVAAAAAALALLSCGVYLAYCRKNTGVNYTYYEDEGVDDNVSDPTSIANYYIDRPIISVNPISVFNSQGGFDA